MTHIGWIAGLARANLRSATAERGTFAMLALFMALNNLIWFTLWWLFFGVAKEIRGWTVTDFAAMYGIVAIAYGIHTAFLGGARLLAHRVIDGGLDIYLGRPRSPLVAIVFSRSDPTGIGDIVSGAAFIFWVTWPDGAKMALALGFAGLGASVIVASYIAINCLVFWSKGRASLTDQLCDCFLMLATMPIMGLPGAAKLLVYTVLPAAFVGFLPVEILRVFSGPKLAAVVLVAFAAPVIAAGIFRLGLRQYASGNRMAELR